jgi:hypothetical protein
MIGIYTWLCYQYITFLRHLLNIKISISSLIGGAKEERIFFLLKHWPNNKIQRARISYICTLHSPATHQARQLRQVQKWVQKKQRRMETEANFPRISLPIL